MKKTLLNLEGSKELSKNEQKNINGGVGLDRRCGGDGSFIFVNGVKVCCFEPWSGLYIC